MSHIEQARYLDNRSALGIASVALKAVALAALMLICLDGGTAEASEFDTIAAGCVPDSSAIQNNYHVTSNGGVSHASGVTTTFSMYCAIPHQGTLTNPSNLSVLYTDSSATASNKIVVEYKKMSMTNGAITTISTLDTDAGPGQQDSYCTQSGPQLCSRTFTNTYDPTNYWYFVVVTISRTSTANTETFWALSIW